MKTLDPNSESSTQNFLKNLTSDDLEIMKMQDGQLQNKSILEIEDSTPSSHKKDDFADLKKQQAAKKIAKSGGLFLEDGSLNMKVLTPKQKDLATAELEKEANLRAKLLTLEANFDKIYKFVHCLLVLPEVVLVST